MRRQPTPPDDDLIDLALRRGRDALTSRIAQTPDAPKLGMEITFTMELDPSSGNSNVKDFNLGVPGDLESLELVASKCRPFILESEDLYGPKVAAAIGRTSTVTLDQDYAQFLASCWKAIPFPRGYVAATKNGVDLLGDEWVAGDHIAKRYIYSRLVHADDERRLFDHLPPHAAEFFLASFVGDCLALLSYQERLVAAARPELAITPTTWAGDAGTIRRRFDGGEEALPF